MPTAARRSERTVERIIEQLEDRWIRLDGFQIIEITVNFPWLNKRCRGE